MFHKSFFWFIQNYPSDFSFKEMELKEMNSDETDSTQLLNELKALDYALVELSLFLDTHPNDENAIKQHNELAVKRHAARERLENHPEDYSPLEASDSNDCRWSLAPWPWQV
jgi:spore coat protein JB